MKKWLMLPAVLGLGMACVVLTPTRAHAEFCDNYCTAQNTVWAGSYSHLDVVGWGDCMQCCASPDYE